MPEVNEKSALEKALAKVDTFLAKELPAVVKDLVQVSHKSEDDRARVSAASKILDYVRPPKNNGVPLVNINIPVNSSLNLPAGLRKMRVGKKAQREIEAELVKHPKILPEPNPLHAMKFKGHFDAKSPQQPGEPILATPAKLRPKFREAGAPAQPPPVSSVGMLPVERQDREKE